MGYGGLLCVRLCLLYSIMSSLTRLISLRAPFSFSLSPGNECACSNAILNFLSQLLRDISETAYLDMLYRAFTVNAIPFSFPVIWRSF